VVHEANYDPSVLDGFAFSSRKFPEHMHFRLLRCPRCTLLFASPAPDGRELDRAYHEAAYDSSVEANDASKTYARYLQRHLDLFTERDGALEIGSGNGSFLGHLLSLGFTNVRGVEPSRAPIEAASPTVRPLLVHAPFRASDFAPSSLALVTCFQTLEHVINPGEITRQIFDRLKPGGGIFFVVHNYEAVLHRFLGKRSPIYDVEHAQLFSPKSLTELVVQAGFEEHRVFGIVNTYPVRYWLRVAPLSRPVKSRLIETLDKAGLGGAKVALPVGNMGVVAIKGTSRPLTGDYSFAHGLTGHRTAVV
jgi:2-polyprenyl-3-methyl-5-hydroxy-6-metoxy-1,4-benzoquinol methylase